MLGLFGRKLESGLEWRSSPCPWVTWMFSLRRAWCVPYTSISDKMQVRRVAALYTDSSENHMMDHRNRGKSLILTKKNAAKKNKYIVHRNYDLNFVAKWGRFQLFPLCLPSLAFSLFIQSWSKILLWYLGMVQSIGHSQAFVSQLCRERLRTKHPLTMEFPVWNVSPEICGFIAG